MKKNKLISIIMPAYNIEKYIENTLNSILKQTYKNIEIILVDDGSVDNTAKIIKKIQKNDKRIKYFYQKNSGVSAARNLAISKSTGDYIYFMDSDDEIIENGLELLVNLIEKNNYDFVRGNFYYSKRGNKYYKKTDLYYEGEINEKQKYQCLKDIINGNIFSGLWLLLLKREFVLSTKLFNENVALMEDKIFYFEIFLKSNNYYLSNNYIYFYYFNDTIRPIQYYQKLLKNTDLVFNDILDINNHYNYNLEEEIKTNGFLFINNAISNIVKDNINKKNIINEFNDCSKILKENIKAIDNISLYSKLLIYAINHKNYLLLKILYIVKKWRSK